MIEEFLQQQGFPTETNSTNQYVLTCPECKKPRHLYVDAETGLYYCQRCEFHGDWEKFVQYFAPPDPLEEIIESFHKLTLKTLVTNKSVLAYLLDSRGFTEDSIAKYRYGFSDSRVEAKMRKQYSEEELIDAGFIGKNDWWVFSNHIIIPYMRDGRYATLQGRNLDDTASHKYDFLLGRELCLYHGEAIYKTGPVIITEGAFKRDRCDQEGINGASLPGANHFKKYLKLLNQCEDLYICMDADAPNDLGETPGQDNAKLLAQSLDRCTIIHLPLDGKKKVGVDDFLDEYMPEALWTLKQTKYENGKPLRSRNLSIVVKEWRKAVEKQDTPPGYMTGHNRLDSWLEGIQPSALTFIAGAPQMAKSTLLEDFLLRIYKRSPEVLIDYFTNDDALRMTIARLIAKLAHLPAKDVRKPLLAFKNDDEAMDRYEAAIKKLSQMSDRVSIADRSYNIKLENLKRDTIAWRKAHPNQKKLIFIDGLGKTQSLKDGQLDNADSLNVHKSALLKDISQEADVGIVVTHEVPKLYGKRPHSWNLRGSAVLEYDADVMLMCYQEAHVKGINNTELKLRWDGEDEDSAIFEVIIGKDKMCGTPQGTVDLFSLVRSESSFRELDQEDYHNFIGLVHKSESNEWKN